MPLSLVRMDSDNGKAQPYTPMSKECCSLDNSARGGWSSQNSMHWYCKDKIKLTLGELSLLYYRRSIGIAVKKNVCMLLDFLEFLEAKFI